MKKNKVREKGKIKKIFTILFAIAYAGLGIFLIAVAATPGTQSAEQSNTVGGFFAEVTNNGKGDQAEHVEPTSLSIDKKALKGEYFVGDSFKLDVSQLPENTTYTSIQYESLDKDIASVDAYGSVRCLKEGKASVKAYNSSFTQVSDTFSFDIKAIKATSIDTSIIGVKEDSGRYLLDANRSYNLSTSLTPSNCTYKNITYSTDAPSDVLEIRESTIIVKKSSDGQLFDITASCKDGLQSTIKVETQLIVKPKIELESISISSTEYTMAVGERLLVGSSNPFVVSFYPTDADDKGFYLTSSDPSILEVSSKYVTGKKNGEVDLTVTSTSNPSLFSTRRVKVGTVHLLSLSNFSLNNMSQAELLVGKSGRITYSGYNPTNASARFGNAIDHVSFSSSNQSVATVDANGNVKAISKGTCTITGHFFDTKEDKSNNNIALTKSLTLDVKEPSKIYDFSINNTLSESSKGDIIYNRKSYNLSSNLSLDKIYDASGHEIIDKYSDKTLSYTVEALSDEKMSYTLNNGVFTSNNDDIATVTFGVRHNASGILKTFTYTLIDEVDYDISLEDEVDDLSSLNVKSNNVKMYVNSTLNLVINDISNGKERYDIKLFGDLDSISKFNETSSTISIFGKDSGNIRINISPILDDIVYDDLSKDIQISILHKYITDFTYHIFSSINQDELVLEEGEDTYQCYIDDSLSLSYDFTPFNKPTRLLMTSSSLDEEIATISDDIISLNKVGKVEIVMKDEASNIEKSFKLHIKNRCELSSDSFFSLSGTHVSFNSDDSTYHIQNGSPASLKINFKEDSTFTDVIYTSSDESVVTIGADGILTPLKKGNALITCDIKDGDSIDMTLKIKLTVDMKKFIDNMSDFLYKIRKGLGHFGAFLVFGICSTCFFFLFFRKKNYPFAAVLNIGQGYFLAALTEFIQRFTPGRAGLLSDVMIDFTGFACAAGTLTVILFIILLVKYLIKKYKKKKE